MARRVECVEALMHDAREVCGGAIVEVYQRSSRRVRVRREPAAGVRSVHEGAEDGLAVRLADRPTGAIAFGAATGSGRRGVRLAMEAATRWRSEREVGVPFPIGDGKLRIDLDDPGSRVGADSLDRWLVNAMEEVLSAARPDLDLEIVSAWLESAVTWELLASSSGVRSARARARSWATFHLRWSAGGERIERPRVIAARGPGRLPGLDALRDEIVALHDRDGEIDTGPLVLAPRSAARLVHALARVLHLDRSVGSLQAGPAYAIREEPSRDGALFGGTTDDTGAPATSVVLAADGLADGGLPVVGHAWRASFRDPPVRIPTNLTVDAASGRFPSRGALVTDLRIVPLEPDRWVLEGLATRIGDGRTTGRGGPFRRAVHPRELPSRFVAAAGPATDTPRGVRTPSLVLDL
jgi:predicted Zn-dependent protease